MAASALAAPSATAWRALSTASAASAFNSLPVSDAELDVAGSVLLIELLGAGVVGAVLSGAVPAPGAGDVAGGMVSAGDALSAGAVVSLSCEQAANRLTEAAMAITAKYVRVFMMNFLTCPKSRFT